jgi:hypothetical protein
VNKAYAETVKKMNDVLIHHIASGRYDLAEKQTVKMNSFINNHYHISDLKFDGSEYDMVKARALGIDIEPMMGDIYYVMPDGTARRAEAGNE